MTYYLKLMLLAAPVFNCPTTLTYNHSKYPWNVHDKEVVSEAKVRCQQLFLDSPCLSRLIKVDCNELNKSNDVQICYHAYCGKGKND